MTSITYLISYLLTLRSRVLLEKLTGSHLVKKLLAWNPKVHYRTHKCPPPVPILRQLDPVHKYTSHFLKILLSIILPSTSGTPKWSLSLVFLHQNLVYASPLPHTRYMPRPSPYCRFCHRTTLGGQYRSLNSSFYSFIHSPVTSSLLGPNILLSTLFSNTLRLCSSLSLRHNINVLCKL